MLLRKLVCGLHSVGLKEEVFRQCESFNDVDSLRRFCVAFEAAQKDARHNTLGGSFGRENLAAVAGVTPLPDAQADSYPQVAGARHQQPTRMPQAARQQQQVLKRCGNCGLKHKQGRGLCYAETLACHSCGRVGHVQKMCRSKVKPAAAAAAEDLEASGIVIAAAGAARSQPRIWVTVSHAKGKNKSAKIQAVPDTGAQVCVAGLELLTSLGVKVASLTRRGGLRDVANVKLQPLGSFPCRLQYGDKSTLQEIFVVKTATQCYISLQACRELGLVHETFPHHTVVVAGAAIGGVGDAATQSADTMHPRPSSPPFPPLEENVSRLEEWLLCHFSGSTFNTDRSPLPTMAGEPHTIHLLPDAKPYACHTPASVPRHWEAEVKRQLDDDVRMGIIEPVPVGEATEWCARMVVVAKKSGQPRRTIDYQKLNAACRRETHHTPTPFDMVSGIPRHTYKTIADAHWGFHQVELQEASKKLTTFITPWGRYRYCRTPMGHCAAPDAYTRRFDEAIAGIQRKVKCVDDTLLFDASVEDAFWHTYNFLETCATKGVTLKPEKFKFGRREVDFVGFHVGWDAYKPTDERLAAIRNFSMPAEPSLTDVRSWHGFVNQMAPFLATAPIMEPFRELLRKPQGRKVYWDGNLQEKFQQAKEVICSLAKEGLTYYDKNKPTAVITDWSKVGIGFVVLQQHCQCPMRESILLQEWVAPRSLWQPPPHTCGGGLRPGRGGGVGGRLVSPALKDIVNPRLFSLKEKTLPYRFQIKYLPGKRNCAVDFLSRYPGLCAPPEAGDEEDSNDMEAAVAAAAVAALDVADSIVLDNAAVVRAAADDPDYQLLVAKVTAGDWHPHRAQELTSLRQYYAVRERLAVSHGLVTYTYDQGAVRLVIPEVLRRRIASNLHAGHQGLDGMLRRARQSVYWPGMEGDLQQHREACATCNTHSPSQAAEPFAFTPTPEYPFQHTVADLFQLDERMYMAYADRLTGWMELAHFPSGATSNKLASVFRQFFHRWGAPVSISTDGGTNLTSEEMRAFFRKWGVERRISSAHFPQSNGRAETAVKSAKRLLRDNTGPGGSLDADKVSVALLQYHNTPLRGVNKSPAQLAMGRQLRDGIPVHKQHYKVDVHWQQALRAREIEAARQQEAWMISQGTPKTLPTLSIGTQVLIQDQASKLWDRRGVVTEVLPFRQYSVKLDGSGRITLRNRRHLRVAADTSLQETLSPSPAPQTSNPPSSNTPHSRPKRSSRKPMWLRDYATDDYDLPALQKQLALETIDSVSSKIPAAHVIYVDGSVQADGRAACAMYSPTLQPPVEAGWIGRRLPVTSSSTFCELHGILDAVTYLVDCNVNGVIVCDSQPALHALSSPRPNYYRVVQAILTQLAVVHEASMAVSLVWMPSHVDLAGNDTVDRIAKAACAFVLDNERVVPSLTCLKNRIHAATHTITTRRRDAERATSVSIQHHDHFLPSRHKYRRRGPMKQ
ncbi:uncharacterized protein LOC143025983 [Oratosquilla oratoria]|uniref:uncharacterized protein LOC143025983 n=1 Tax=Oratosquilla oratoria TaxID=337810 RepID=UPI003F76C5C9